MKTVYQVEYWHYHANEPFPECAFENPRKMPSRNAQALGFGGTAQKIVGQ